MGDKKERESSVYRIDICDGYYATKDKYCFTLYNTRNKKATAINPNVDESETVDKCLGYYTEVDSMLWAIVNNKVDAKALSKKNNIQLSEYITIYENVRDEVMNATTIKV